MAGEPRGAESTTDRADGPCGAPLAQELAELIEWEHVQRRRDLRRAELLAAVHAAGLTDIDHGHSTPAWLAHSCAVPDATARSLVRLAVRLRDRYPLLAEALREGRVGWQHVATFDRAANPRVADDLIELLPELIDLAGLATFERWSKELRGLAERLDQDGGYDPAADRTLNELHLTPTLDGITHVSGRLVGELAVAIRSIINAEADRVAARHRADAELSGETELPSPAQARAEALAELLDRAAGAGGTGAVPQPELVVTYHADTGDLADNDGNALSPILLRWLIAAALIRPLELTNTGDPLRMGHAIRYANREQRRALAVRDGGCVFPGCTRPASWCDAHHVDHWDHDHPDDGGATDIENMALLCRHHHRVTHRPGWVMERWHPPDRPDAVSFRWHTPAARVVHSQRHGVQQRSTA